MLELEYTLIPHGLHVVGEPLSREERVDMLLAMAEADAWRRGCRAKRSRRWSTAPSVEAIARDEATPRDASADSRVSADHLSRDHEIAGILRALDGRFVRPAPGGDLLRTPEVLPTGRNLHGFDPFRIPSAYAVQDGARQAARLLERYLERRPRAARDGRAWCCGAPTI